MKTIDTDISEDARKCYSKIYSKSLIWVKGEKNGKYSFEFKGIEKEIEVAGDVCVNFGMAGKFGFLNSFQRKKGEKLRLPESFEKYCNTILNMSILPITGGLNLAKKSIGWERIDSFIWALHLYYKGQKTLIMNNGSATRMRMANREVMADFLDSFGSIDEFCGKIYGISTDTVEKMIKSGCRSVTKSDELKEYMFLVLDFWEERAKTYQKIKGLKDYLPNENDKLLINKDEIKDEIENWIINNIKTMEK